MQAPPIFRPGPVAIRCFLGRVELPDGRVIVNDQYGHPIRPDLALAYAIDEAYRWPDPVIGLGPGIFSAHIGRGDPKKATNALWPNGAVINGVTLVSLDPATPAGVSLSFDGDVTVPGQGGVSDFSIIGVDLVARWYASASKPYADKTPLITYLGSTHGLIRVIDSYIWPENPGAFNGYGMMWGCRSQGWAIHEWRRVKAGYRPGKQQLARCAQEHGLAYVDAPQGDSYFLECEQLAPSGRTGLQFDERMNMSGYGGSGYNGRTPRQSVGGLMVKNAKLWTDSGGGGSALTVAGHSGGPVIVENLNVKGDLGALVVWADTPKGCFLTPDGKICPQFVLTGFRSDAVLDDRSLVAIKGCSLVDVYLDTRDDGSPDSLIKTNRIGLDFDNQYGGPINNGRVALYAAGRASQYAGFQAGTKVKRHGVTQTDAQIDAMNLADPGTHKP